MIFAEILYLIINFFFPFNLSNTSTDLMIQFSRQFEPNILVMCLGRNVVYPQM